MEQIKLNTIPSGVPSVCHISQFDNTSRIIRCHLFNGSDPLTLTGSETIRLFIRKSDNSRAEFEIESASGSFIDLVITSEMSDIAGDSECKFQITDSEKTIGTLNFKMIVEPDAYGDSLKTRSISGPIATFETDLAEDLIKLDVDLEPVQDLHGYDYPWPAGGGKNLLGNFYDWAAWSPTLASYGNCPTSYANKGLLLNTKPNTTYTISIELVPNLEQVPKYLYVASANGTDVSTRLAYITNGTTLVSATFTFTTTATDIYYLRVNTNYINSQATFDTEIGNKVKWIQLEAGSTATAWAPYSNICPISGHDSAQLLRTGKNLLNKESYDWISNSNIIFGGTNTTISDSFILNPGTYTLYCSHNVSGFYIDNNDGVIKRAYNRNSTTFSINSRQAVRINFYIAGVTQSDLLSYDYQLELGSTATDYEPYISDPTPVTVQFGQTVYGGTLDSASRRLRVDTRYMIFDGTQEVGRVNWRPLSNSVGWLYRPDITPNIRNYVIDESNLPSCKLKSNKLQTVVYGGAQGLYGKDSPCISLVGTEYWGLGMRVNDTSLTNATAINNWLSQNPIEVIYELSEPFFIDLTQVQTASIESSPVASFETTLARPLETSEHSFSCSQAEGTPTPDSPIPITGVSEITAFRTGKNLLPNKKRQRSEYSVHIGIENANDSIFLKAGTYVLNVVTNIDRAATFLIGDNTAQRNLGNTYPLTFTIDHDDYFKLWVYKSEGITVDDITSFQLELGSTATEYEPYSGESITVSLGGTYYGGKLVQSEDGSRKIVLRYAQLVLSSANANIINRVNANKYRVFNADCGAKITGSDYADIKCNKMSSQTGTTNDNRCYINSAGDIRMNFTSEYDTVVDMIAAMESITVVYPLETPIEIDLPDGDPLNAVVGENNVYCNTGDTALTYYFNMVADPIRIPALVGTNNVYSDAGDVDVEYYTTLEGGND